MRGKNKRVAKHRVFEYSVALEGRQVGSLKWRVWSHLGRWEIKNCTPLWREADFELKMLKHLSVGAVLVVQMSKKCTPMWRAAHLELKMYKAPSWDVESCRSQKGKNIRCSDRFWTFTTRFAWRAQWMQHFYKCEGFLTFSKTMTSVGHLKRICTDAFRVAGAVQECLRQVC